MCIRYDPLAVTQSAVQVTGLCVLFIAAAWLAAAWREPSSARAVAIVTGFLLVVTAWSAIEEPFLFPYGHGFGDPEARNLFFREMAALRQHHLTQRTLELVGIAALGLGACLAVAIRDVRRGRRVTNLGLFSGTLVLGLGTLAFAATRAKASDARLAVPHVPWVERCEVESPALAETTSACRAPTYNPVLDLTDGGAKVDGQELSEDGLVKVLESKKQLSAAMNPGRPLRDRVSVAAREDTLVRAMRLPQLVSAGFPRVVLLTRRAWVQIPTKTIGAFSLHPRCCGLEIRLDPHGEPASEYRTYADLLHAADDAERESKTLMLAP